MATTHQRAVGLRELKAHLSAHMSSVKAGHSILVTQHGRAIARIIPEHETPQARLDACVKAGLVAWSGRGLRIVAPRIRPAGGTVAALVSEGRD